MITTIYLVKKNPNKPDSEDNWLTMSIAEFNEFIRTPEAKGRYFADLGAHEYSDVWYIAECDKATALKGRKEFNRHYYLKRMERESGFQTVSMSSLIIGDELYNGEEIIADPDADVVAEVMQKIALETLETALDSLSAEEFAIIHHMYLAEETLSEREYARVLGVPRMTLRYWKMQALEKVRKYF